MKYYIIAGEASGDLHGSNLMKGIYSEDPEAEIRFWGGDLMHCVWQNMETADRNSGMVRHYKDGAVMGFVEVVAKARKLLGNVSFCKEDILEWMPDVVILIDYPGFNFKIAEFAHKAGFKVFYYIAPKVWAWKERRVKSLRKYVDRLYTIFPFETEYFRGHGIEPTFCGNPLVDDITERKRLLPSREQFISDNNLSGKPIVALLAGSRLSEIKANLPDMVAIARRFADIEFVVTAVKWIDITHYERYIADTNNVKIVVDRTQQTLAMAEAAIVTSGTATLETALMGIPEIVTYHVPWLYEKLKPYFLRIPYISLVNINLGREAVRELVCAKLDIDNASDELRSILPNGSKRREMLADFEELREMMGGEGASDRFAHDIVKTLRQ